jgi:hypothetical protein
VDLKYKRIMRMSEEQTEKQREREEEKAVKVRTSWT